MKHILLLLFLFLFSCSPPRPKSEPVFKWHTTKNEVGYGTFYYENNHNVYTYAGVTKKDCDALKKLYRNKFKNKKWNRKIWVSKNNNASECYCQFYEYTPGRVFAKIITLTRYSPPNGRLAGYLKDYSYDLQRYRYMKKKYQKK